MTINPPLFSLVTITKDNLSGLQTTATSIAHQSCRDFEWIIIDGNSSDGTKNYLQTLDAIITSEPDSGIYDAMNKGIDRASGEYILFLNAGDALADMDILATLTKALQDKPDFLYGDALETNGLYKKARSHTGLDWGMFTHHQAMLYRRDKIGPLRYATNLKIAADYGFTVGFLKNAKKIDYIPCAVCIFDDGGISQTNRTLGRREQFLIRRENGECSPFKNMMVYACQSMAALIKDHAPALYRKLR